MKRIGSHLSVINKDSLTAKHSIIYQYHKYILRCNDTVSFSEESHSLALGSSQLWHSLSPSQALGSFTDYTVLYVSSHKQIRVHSFSFSLSPLHIWTQRDRTSFRMIPNSCLFTTNNIWSLSPPLSLSPNHRDSFNNILERINCFFFIWKSLSILWYHLRLVV